MKKDFYPFKKPSSEAYAAWKEALDAADKAWLARKELLYEAFKDWNLVYKDQELTALFRAFREAYNRCPDCSSDNTSVRNYDSLWQDGDLVCDDCNTRVRGWDAG